MASSDGKEHNPKSSQDEIDDLAIVRKWRENQGNVYKMLQDWHDVVERITTSLPQNQASRKKDKDKNTEPKVLEFAIKPANEDMRIENQIKQYIEQPLDKKEFKIKTDFNWQQRKTKIPLVVFCNYASRIGSDVEYALRGVDDPQVILIVLHLCRKQLLTGSLYDTDYLLSDALKSRVAFIVHFAFDDVVYDCEQNREARKHICDQLSQKLTN